jgi:prevent-host-death family protein
MNVSATQLRMNFFEYLDTVQQYPIIVEKHHKPIAVLISYQLYSSIKKDCIHIRAPSKSVQTDLAGYLDTTLVQPVVIETRPGGPVAVMISYQVYQPESIILD